MSGWPEKSCAIHRKLEQFEAKLRRGERARVIPNVRLGVPCGPHYPSHCETHSRDGIPLQRSINGLLRSCFTRSTLYSIWK